MGSKSVRGVRGRAAHMSCPGRPGSGDRAPRGAIASGHRGAARQRGTAAAARPGRPGRGAAVEDISHRSGPWQAGTGRTAGRAGDSGPWRPVRGCSGPGRRSGPSDAVPAVRSRPGGAGEGPYDVVSLRGVIPLLPHTGACYQHQSSRGELPLLRPTPVISGRASPLAAPVRPFRKGAPARSTPGGIRTRGLPLERGTS